MPSMPIRLLAVDLDGTLLNSRSEVSSANRQALATAARRGVEVAIVTGRRFHSALPFLKQLDCRVTVISSNGARIGNLEGEVCHRNFLRAALAREAVRTAPEAARRFAVVMYDVAGRGQVIMQDGASPEGPIAWYRRTAPDALLEVADLEAAISLDPPDPIQVMFGGPPAEIEPLEPLLANSAIAPRVHLTWTKYPLRGTVILDVMPRGCTKGAALRLWAAQRGIGAAEVMAIGDNHNDCEMLEFAGRPVVMANAEPGVCRDGWRVTLSNDEDGVAAAVEQYVLRS
jgi:Cof subfamily protein (haloacid dehalogenase superfamily)